MLDLLDLNIEKLNQMKLYHPENLRKLQHDAEQYEEKYAKKMFEILESYVKVYKSPGAFDLGSGVTDRHIPRIIETINSNAEIDNLFCNSNIGNYGIKMMAEKLKYVKKLSVDATNIGDDPKTTRETILAIANSAVIKTIMISRSTLKNEDIDLLLAHSRQTKVILGNNMFVDDNYRELARAKGRENSAKLLEGTFLGSTPSKRLKAASDSEQTSPHDSPEDELSGKNII